MNQTIVVKELSSNTITSIFHGPMQKDFPVEERKPLEFLLNLKEKELYSCYGLYEDNELCGYAFFCKSNQKNCLLLDYLAIQEDCRSRGFGSLFLEKLKETCHKYDGIILEVESISMELSNDILETRMRRISFYERNGTSRTNYSAIVRKVLYDIMYLPCKKNLDEIDILEETNVLYRCLFSEVPCWELFATK